jgi:hypothetical protein
MPIRVMQGADAEGAAVSSGLVGMLAPDYCLKIKKCCGMAATARRKIYKYLMWD